MEIVAKQKKGANKKKTRQSEVGRRILVAFVFFITHTHTHVYVCTKRERERRVCKIHIYCGNLWRRYRNEEIYEVKEM